MFFVRLENDMMQKNALQYRAKRFVVCTLDKLLTMPLFYRWPRLKRIKPQVITWVS